MSRLEMNAEPSMEEILASIRKIIAEEPPGSRAVPSSARMGALSPATSRCGRTVAGAYSAARVHVARSLHEVFGAPRTR